jgi:hypothetical protein
MKYVFSREINGDIVQVEDCFRENLLPWWNDLDVYYGRMQDDLTWRVLPAVVLSIYRHFDLNRALGIAMANIFKMIYFSYSIHALIKDDEEGQIYDDKLQFAILVGDYIFGTALKSLVRSGTTSLVGNMSEMMCELNEGMVLQNKMQADKARVLEKTKAPLYGTSFLTAARLAGLNQENQEMYRQLGCNLGMSIELLADKQFVKVALPYINNVETLMQRCKSVTTRPSYMLERVVKDLQRAICGDEKFAVV